MRGKLNTGEVGWRISLRHGMSALVDLLSGFTLELFSFLVVLHLSNLGKDDFFEDCATSNLAQTRPLPGTRCIAIGCRRSQGWFCLVGAAAQIFAARNVFVILHFERLDAVGQLDNFNTTPETGAGHVGSDLRQQVTVASGFALQPRVLQGNLGRGALSGIGLEEGNDEVLGVLGDALPITFVEDDVAASALFNQVGHGFGTEGRISTQQGICDNTEGP